MTRIATVDLATSQGRATEHQTPFVPIAVQGIGTPQQLVQLVHVASVLLRKGEAKLAQQVLDEACALAALPGLRTEGARLCAAATQSAEIVQLIRGQAVQSRPGVGQAREVSEVCPVRIHTLGAFEIRINGVAFFSGIKPQRRPLDLLKLLLLSDLAPIGAGELADKLWPDSDGDTARNCLQVAVHRLRRLLGHEHAVLVHDRKLHLNRELCRVDLWEFEAEVTQLTGMSIGEADFAPRAARALRLYRGHLFAHETDQAWMLAPRERVRRTWLDLVRRLGRHHEMRGEWDAAYELYQRAIELDPLAEEVYRRLMLCQHTMGQRNEALYTYQRCRRQLAAVLGVAPSAEIERLYRVLRSAS